MDAYRRRPTLACWPRASKIRRSCACWGRQAGKTTLTSLGTGLGIPRDTVEHYLAVCERLYLVRRLSPWHRNPANRPIKSPKVHVVDSGLAAALTGLTAEDWSRQRERFGHLLESFVVQQLIAQASWTRACVGCASNAARTGGAACCSTPATASLLSATAAPWQRHWPGYGKCRNHDATRPSLRTPHPKPRLAWGSPARRCCARTSR